MPPQQPQSAPELDDYDLDPAFYADLQKVVDLMKQAGIPMTIVSGKRSTAKQMALYAKGRVPGTGAKVTELDGVTKKSNHQRGMAADRRRRHP